MESKEGRVDEKKYHWLQRLYEGELSPNPHMEANTPYSTKTIATRAEIFKYSTLQT